MSATQAVGAELRGIRNRLGMTQAYVCEQTGLSPSGLNRIEHGSRDINVEQLVALAQLYGTTPARIVADAEEHMPQAFASRTVRNVKRGQKRSGS